jgi:predicted nucleotidyltransferase
VDTPIRKTRSVDKVMTSLDPRLGSAVAAIIALVQPEAVLLFDGRARGDDDDASDWDRFVVLPDDAPPAIARPSALRRTASTAKLPRHAVACRRAVFEVKRHDPNSLSHDVARVGVVLPATGLGDAAKWVATADVDIDAARRCLADPLTSQRRPTIASKLLRSSSRLCWLL